MAAARVHGYREAGSGAHAEEGNYAPRHQQLNDRHAQQAHIEVLHQHGGVALPCSPQKQDIGNTKHQQFQELC